MKKIIVAVMMMFAASVFAADPAPAKKVEPTEKLNCVTKDKKGNCPPAPKSEKPTPKKKAEAAPAPAAKASEPAKK